jgi:hypothetical protein
LEASSNKKVPTGTKAPETKVHVELLKSPDSPKNYLEPHFYDLEGQSQYAIFSKIPDEFIFEVGDPCEESSSCEDNNQKYVKNTM